MLEKTVQTTNTTTPTDAKLIDLGLDAQGHIQLEAGVVGTEVQINDFEWAYITRLTPCNAVKLAKDLLALALIADNNARGEHYQTAV